MNYCTYSSVTYKIREGASLARGQILSICESIWNINKRQTRKSLWPRETNEGPRRLGVVCRRQKGSQ